MSVPKDPLIGVLFGQRFRIDALIGRGATADVYRAFDSQTQKPVALKILKRAHISDATSLKRFAREAEVQSRVKHRNVAALMATGVTSEAEPYLIMELLRGRSLRNLIRTEGKVSPRRAASYAWQALQGLEAVHAQGILHRDLKPANIMLEPTDGLYERAVLIDFGFASFEGSAKLTLQGTVVGSLTYMAPERLRGEGADERADLYAVGLILFELLTGRAVFVAENELDLIDMHCSTKPESLRALDPRLPAELDDVVQIALAKYPHNRYPSATAMATAVERAAIGLTE